MEKKKEKLNKGEIVIFKPKSGEVKFEVKFQGETVWLTQKQIAELFDVERSVITKHIRNVLKVRELKKNSVCAIFAHTAKDGKTYRVEYYNLDMILSAGYRVNSAQATRFRIWATRVLKAHIIQGFTIDKKRILGAESRFRQLQNTIEFLRKKAHSKILKGQEQEIINLLADYSRTLTLLEQYDKNKLKKISGSRAGFKLKYNDCLKIISSLKKELINKNEAGNIFGVECGYSFEGIVKNIYQTFGDKELYKDLETKAAHLLYFGIKDHPFSDGNKRISSFLFVYFLDKNNFLYRNYGEKKINDSSLAALALLVAESDPKEKNQMIALITQLLK
jgi:prophage maintenance system killer protein